MPIFNILNNLVQGLDPHMFRFWSFIKKWCQWPLVRCQQPVGQSPIKTASFMQWLQNGYIAVSKNDKPSSAGLATWIGGQPSAIWRFPKTAFRGTVRGTKQRIRTRTKSFCRWPQRGQIFWSGRPVPALTYRCQFP